MKKYRIIIKNGYGCEIENTIIYADDPTQAIIEFLKNENDLLESDDVITIIEEKEVDSK